MRMAMTLRLTDDETAALRAQADAEQRSMHDVARRAIREYTAQQAHRARVADAIAFVMEHHQGALRELADL
jgi:predicted transcriptional regulator